MISFSYCSPFSCLFIRRLDELMRALQAKLVQFDHNCPRYSATDVATTNTSSSRDAPVPATKQQHTHHRRDEPLARVTVSCWLRTETESTHTTRRSIPAELNIMSAVFQVKVSERLDLSPCWTTRDSAVWSALKSDSNYLIIKCYLQNKSISGILQKWLASLNSIVLMWNLDFHMRATDIHPWFSSFHNVDAIFNVWTQSMAAESCEQMWVPHFHIQLAFFKCEQILSTCDNGIIV